MPQVAMDQVAGTTVAAPPALNVDDYHDFARRYTEAWNSHDPALVATFFEQDARFTINDDPPYEGSEGVIEMVRGFSEEIPGFESAMTGLEAKGGQLVYHWRVTGTHAASDRPVVMQGIETWTLSANGLIQDSVEWFDAADYQRQLDAPPQQGVGSE